METTMQRRRVVCPENEGLAESLWKKRQEMAERKPKGLSENIDMTLRNAYYNVCTSKTPITTLKGFSEIKGVGKWILRLMQEFFETDSGGSQNEDFKSKGKTSVRTKCYVPQKNSVAYALLVTLYRGIANGTDFMQKQELIDAAEASGLSRVPIAPEKGKGKPGQFGSSTRDWYSGWSCMKTLITKGLVVKSSCPAKYMLTEEGLESARECLLRSGQIDLITTKGLPNLGPSSNSDLGVTHDNMAKDMTVESISLSQQPRSIDVFPQSLDRFLQMGYSKDQVLCAFDEVSGMSQHKDIFSLWPAMLCHLREKHLYDQLLEPDKCLVEAYPASLKASTSRDCQVDIVTSGNSLMEPDDGGPSHLAKGSFALKTCSSLRPLFNRASQTNRHVVAMPPLAYGDRFLEAYEVILILDDREQFAAQGSRSRKIIENVCTQFNIQIKVRRLPIGDAIWIAKHNNYGSEYVLDFIVERKKIDDLRCSIRDSRYKDQKLRLLRCGLKKLIYVVEGDPNSSEAAESIKTACFTTEILEGFNVQRTNGLGNTLRNYGFLTQAIAQYYKSLSPEKEEEWNVCPTFDEFIKRCQNLEKMTVSDVFATQLMQVPQVTEDVADAVLDLYPTLLSLARAYSLLDGDARAQEEMLKNQSNNIINAAASRNIFEFVWGN